MRKRKSHFYGCRVAKVCTSPAGSSFSLSERFIFLFFSLRVTSRGSERAASQECRYDFFFFGGGAPVVPCALQQWLSSRVTQTHSHDPLSPLTCTAGGESAEPGWDGRDWRCGGCRRWREVEVGKKWGKTPVQTHRGHATTVDSSTATQHTINN